MSKLIVTYVEGFVACFTESRTGMQQRALIDVGDSAPSPQALAELGGVLADEWGWMNRIERSTAHVRKGELTTTRPSPRKVQHDLSDPKGADRQAMILRYLAQNPDVPTKAIVEGLGFEPDHKRVARWAFTMSSMVKAGLVISKSIQYGTVRRYLYSLPEGA
jgi:hypothetical protein